MYSRSDEVGFGRVSGTARPGACLRASRCLRRPLHVERGQLGDAISGQAVSAAAGVVDPLAQAQGFQMMSRR